MHVILSLEQQTYSSGHTWMKEAITSAEIGEQSFGYTGFIFFAHEYLCQILKK